MLIEKFAQALLSESALKKFLNTEEFISLVKDNFAPARVPYVHSFKVENGGEIRFKFIDTVKTIRNSKNQEVVGKESFLSYVEITAMPIGFKAFAFAQDVTQLVWATGKAKASEKHMDALQKLVAKADKLGINLSKPSAWCTIYSTNY